MIENISNSPRVTPRVVKLREAASYLGISPSSVRRLIKRGLIKANRALRHILIPVAELDRFLEEGRQ
jgi:excisionase family DNA binding protein